MNIESMLSAFPDVLADKLYMWHILYRRYQMWVSVQDFCWPKECWLTKEMELLGEDAEQDTGVHSEEDRKVGTQRAPYKEVIYSSPITSVQSNLWRSNKKLEPFKIVTKCIVTAHSLK